MISTGRFAWAIFSSSGTSFATLEILSSWISTSGLAIRASIACGSVTK